ncbi:MAG: IcmT/TraK family protein [Pseudomonadota bacterium]|nr:IcmT/TraK family protein [Pseudomonadota bacterium]
MDIHWRNTQKPARFYILDARSFAALFLFLIHARLWTFILAILTMIVFWLLEQRGLTFEASLRGIRSWIFGQRRPSNSRRAIRHWIDYG